MTLFDMHLKNNYTVSVSAIKGLPGLKVEIPKNIFTDTEAKTYIYEVEPGKVSIYANRRKVESIECPDYAIRSFICVDIDSKVTKSRMSQNLIRYLTVDGEVIPKVKGGHPINTILPMDSEINELESLLDNAIVNVSGSKNASENEIPEEIYEGFLIVVNRFISENKQ